MLNAQNAATHRIDLYTATDKYLNLYANTQNIAIWVSFKHI